MRHIIFSHFWPAPKGQCFTKTQSHAAWLALDIYQQHIQTRKPIVRVGMMQAVSSLHHGNPCLRAAGSWRSAGAERWTWSSYLLLALMSNTLALHFHPRSSHASRHLQAKSLTLVYLHGGYPVSSAQSLNSLSFFFSACVFDTFAKKTSGHISVDYFWVFYSITFIYVIALSTFFLTGSRLMWKMCLWAWPWLLIILTVLITAGWDAHRGGGIISLARP